MAMIFIMVFLVGFTAGRLWELKKIIKFVEKQEKEKNP
jgi:hypothetical protein